MNALLEQSLYNGSWQNSPLIMRVAIAGSGGLAYWIAHYLSTETFHPFIILSRAVRTSAILCDGKTIETDSHSLNLI